MNPMVLYFIHMPGCGACERAKPQLKKWQKMNPQIRVIPIDITTAKWVHPWQPEVTPTYVAEVPGRQRIQYQGMLTAEEIPKFIAKAERMMGLR
jgi:thiol-disulfide isomerase/thioredoxin